MRASTATRATRWTILGASAALGSVLAGTQAVAGGLGLYEVGSPDLGTASAGRAALAGTLQGDYESNSLDVIGFTGSHKF